MMMTNLAAKVNIIAKINSERPSLTVEINGWISGLSKADSPC
jgi:hypothetical protein